MASKALLVGINAYTTANPLRGCLNDVVNIKDALLHVGHFSQDRIKTLTDGDAKKTKLLDGLDWLYADCAPGDHVLFHFSGHGSFTSDGDGDEKEDGVDELICLPDMDFNNKDTFVTDDELRAWLERAPKDVRVTVFLDNCHSGTGTRKVWPVAWNNAADKWTRSAGPQFTPPGKRAISAARASSPIFVLQPEDSTRSTAEPEYEAAIARFIEPPHDVAARRSLGLLKDKSALRSMQANKHVLLAACRSDQTAADAYINNSFNGAFTYYLADAIRSLGAGATYESLHERIVSALRNKYQQIPQLEGDYSGSLFASKDSAVLSKPPKEEGGIVVTAPRNILQIEYTVDLTALTPEEKGKIKNNLMHRLAQAFDAPKTQERSWWGGGGCSHERHERTQCGGGGGGN